MALSNPEVGPEWSTLVDDGDEFFLSMPFSSSVSIQLAPVAAGGSVDAGLAGHVLRSGELQEMNRALIGPGEIKARCPEGTVIVTLSTWT